MRFIPDYRVCYKGVFYECDEEFDIDPTDADEMSEHGEVVDEPTPPAEEPAEGKTRRGRPRRTSNDQPGEDASADE